MIQLLIIYQISLLDPFKSLDFYNNLKNQNLDKISVKRRWKIYFLRQIKKLIIKGFLKKTHSNQSLSTYLLKRIKNPKIN